MYFKMKSYLWISVLFLISQPPKINSASLPGSRIIEGDEVSPHSLPYQVFLNFTGDGNATWICGGSLITREYVLSAGICGNGAISVEITLGAHNISDAETTQAKVMSEDIIVHQNFKKNVQGYVYENDIAVIHLPEPVELTDSIQTVKLPDGDEAEDAYIDKTGRVSGWGQLHAFDADEMSPVLLSLDNTIISNEECVNVYYDLKDYDICMLTTEEKSPCEGDYGSPLVVDGVQVGIASQSVMNCIPGYPFVFTRVLRFLDWVKENTDYSA